MMELGDEAATVALARRIAAVARAGDVIALAGDLGTGKTRFARAFVDAAAGDGEEVPSPTFTLVQTYDAAVAGAAVEIRHFDLYRLKSPDETLELGIEEAFAEAITLVEWPDRLGSLKPREHLEIRLSIAGDGARQARLVPSAAWRDRVAAIARAFA
jgi:tRNA threonylcarbamoyladenosine biosynthesis protein TsaE